MNNLIVILFSTILLASCSREIDLDKEHQTLLNFEELPSELKKIYSTKFPTAIDTVDYLVFSLDKNHELTHYWTGLHKQLLTKGFNHHFLIGDKQFKLGANQGNPFVLRNNKLYYTTELNLDVDNYKEAKYIETDLTEYLTEKKASRLL